MTRVNIKPLSTNDAWQGRRFKSPAYKKYERDVLFLLPRLKLPDPPYQIYIRFGYSNAACDFDNGIKQTVDCLSKKYNFNDKLIRRALIDVEITKKGQEYFEFEIQTLSI